jgi:hypothetical protein
MKIDDVFHLSDGRYAFIGKVITENTFSSSRRCVLIINGVETQELTIHIDFIEKRPSLSELDEGDYTQSNIRSYSTTDKINLTHEIVTTCDCILLGL